jgi:hypothetical protein
VDAQECRIPNSGCLMEDVAVVTKNDKDKEDELRKFLVYT